MIATLLLTALLAGSPAAQQGPPPFVVTAADGHTVSGASLLAGDRKVIVYVAPGLEPAERLVDALERWAADEPAWRQRVVIVVAAPLASAREWLTGRWEDAELPTWVADVDAEGWRAFGFQGSIGIAGVENGAVDWKLDGVIGDPSVVERPMRAWTGIGGQ
jgi:hypothetical protein